MESIESIKYKMEKLGYSLFEIDPTIDVAQLIIDIIRTKDLRLIRGIPLIIHQSFINEELLKEPTIKLDILAKLAKKESLTLEVNSLIYITRSLFHKLNLGEKRILQLDSYLKNNSNKEELEIFRVYLENQAGFLSYSYEAKYLKNDLFRQIDTESFLETSYADITAHELNRHQKAYINMLQLKDLDIKYALSRLFTERQQAIIHKINDARKLTKTEYEYYIRNIKKKLKAIILLNETAEITLNRDIYKDKADIQISK